jgi:hypothetical protein
VTAALLDWLGVVLKDYGVLIVSCYAIPKIIATLRESNKEVVAMVLQMAENHARTLAAKSDANREERKDYVDTLRVITKEVGVIGKVLDRIKCQGD